MGKISVVFFFLFSFRMMSGYLQLFSVHICSNVIDYSLIFYIQRVKEFCRHQLLTRCMCVWGGDTVSYVYCSALLPPLALAAAFTTVQIIVFIFVCQPLRFLCNCKWDFQMLSSIKEFVFLSLNKQIQLVATVVQYKHWTRTSRVTSHWTVILWDDMWIHHKHFFQNYSYY